MKTVKFISYDGRWPSYCHGTLILEINGVEHKFHPGEIDGSYPRFWRSGGCIGTQESVDGDVNFYTEEGPWIVNEDELPEHLQPYAEEIRQVMNENMEWGCCGGCI